jgi:serine/threonine protein kinase
MGSKCCSHDVKYVLTQKYRKANRTITPHLVGNCKHIEPVYKLTEFVKGVLIGIGKVSNVYSAMSVNTGELVAYKVVHMDRIVYYVFREKLAIMYNLDHINILKYYNIENPYNEEKEGTTI